MEIHSVVVIVFLMVLPFAIRFIVGVASDAYFNAKFRYHRKLSDHIEEQVERGESSNGTQ